MCDWLNEKLEQSPDWLSHIWLSNEARFHLHGAVNNNNNVFWGEEKPKKSVRTSLEFRKDIVFVALNAKHGLMGNYWFEENGRPVTTYSKRCLAIFDTFMVT